MVWLEFLILRKPQSGCLEGRTALIQPVVNFLTASKAGAHGRTVGADGPLRHRVCQAVTL